VDFPRQISKAPQDVQSYATSPKHSKGMFYPSSPASARTSINATKQLILTAAQESSLHHDTRPQQYETKPSREGEQARSHPNSDSEADIQTRIIDPNVDYDKYPDYEVSQSKRPPNVDDNETPRGDMSDIYRPEGDFGLARPWLRPVYDVDAEEPDYSEEMAAWERQKEETGESIYIPPGKTIDDLKWGRPLDKDVKRE